MALKRRNFSWTMLALCSFFIGDILIINSDNVYFLGVSLLFFTLGKLFFCFRFSHKSDFRVSRLIPFSIVVFFYSIALLTYIFNDLGVFFFPALVSYFVSLLLCQFAYIRKEVVNKRSYLSVFVGVLFYMLSEGIMAIKTFKTDVPYQDFTIMFFYAMGVYLIVNGVVIEKRKEAENLF